MSPMKPPSARAGGAIAVSVLLAGPFLSLAEPWGFDAHRLVTRRSTAALPAPLGELYLANATFLAEHSIDPDLWAGSGREGEGPNHFLDLDAFGAYPFASIPKDEAAHLRKNGEEAGKKGRVPWRTAEAWRDLVKAFGDKDSRRILETSAILAHYAADAHVPLHAVVNYDGKETGQPGVHSRWETGLLAHFERQIVARLGPAKMVKIVDPTAFVFDVLEESYRNAEAVLASDRACAGPADFIDTPEDDRYDDAYWTALYEREGTRITSRLTSASGAVASLWQSAWIAAGRPTVDGRFRMGRVRRQAKVALITIDGSPAPLLADAMARGVMPNLERLRSTGATSFRVTSTRPAPTAVAHATVYTGAWPSSHGVTGNRIATASGTLDGFASTSLLAEPLWITAARQGLAVTTLGAPQSSPFSPWEADRRFGGNFSRQLTVLAAYDGPPPDEGVVTERDLAQNASNEWKGAPASAREIALAGQGRALYALAFDDPANPQIGLDTVLVAPRRDFAAGVRLTTTPTGEEAFGRLPGATPTEMPTFLRLFDLAPDGSRLLLYRIDGRAVTSNRARAAAEVNRATGGSIGNGASRLYGSGAFGPTLAQGGDGAAERRYLETVRLVTHQFMRLAEIGLQRTRWEFLIGYLPYPDEALHAWMGYLDPRTPGHDPALAARLAPFVDTLLGLVDEYVGAVARLAGDGSVVIVTADHGMTGVSREVRINEVLKTAGLLVTSADGSVDVERTRLWCPPTNPSFIVRGGGAAEAGDLAAAAAALLAVTDPASGTSVVDSVWQPGGPGAPAGLGGPRGGALYYSLAAGYAPTSALGDGAVGPRPPSGTHAADPALPSMQVPLVVSGPGIATGTDLGTLDLVDMAPTFALILAIDPPRDSEGRAASAVLSATSAAAATR